MEKELINNRVCNNINKLSDDQVEHISKELDKEIKGTILESIANMPSNNGIIERSTDNVTEEGEKKKVLVHIDPNTGEHRIDDIVDNNFEKDNKSFEELCDSFEIKNSEPDKSPITKEELINYINKDKDSFLIQIIEKENEYLLKSDQFIEKLLDTINKKFSEEEFNIYKELPEEFKKILDKYISMSGIPIFTETARSTRNSLCEQLIDEIISNISMERLTNSFNKEVEDIFSKGASEIADSVIGYTKDRNNEYRKYAESLEDKDKKEKVLQILDSIDEAYNISNLKEFSKKCKIKNIELQKPKRIYSSFLDKYKNSTYNIYNINLCRPILYRGLNSFYKEENFTDKDIDAFFICFCKQCINMKESIATDHAYMYYVLYNIVLIDINKGENKSVSENFLNNVYEVIINLRKRNNNFK